MEKLTEARIEELLGSKAPEWAREDEKWIVRKFRFREFLQAVAFVNAVAQEAERLNHHPFIAIDYKLVTLRMTSWHAGGLTELDFTAAAAFDAAYASL
ncbi:pterin-4-alpha-carbinolamine dehydratase [Gordoniibacillus kamchatkensis]|uniref:4a-hydroxytetrahydrobiopterin dehydratase n=1 Tax=Gordoniibacillus kamchatkensis TaxID=1590651 RepID=A0ABR5AF75_9BACL|nr:4a-hydroxytetrahydrobiopterin dehydratase [Paenibacillus sp. VKM B-2647]KIL39705.1 pterin-4-alpha-carbinolamine dehydratase [Paenibacillus sp. VKM B-2647]